MNAKINSNIILNLFSNIMISNSYKNLKYVDFGLAKETESHSQKMKTKVGTARYAAPEIFCQPKFDQKVDVW
jgi:serine/threonine protein kinase